MESKNQSMELILLDKINTEEFAQVLVNLVKNNREVRKVIMELVLTSPYIVREY